MTPPHFNRLTGDKWHSPLLSETILAIYFNIHGSRPPERLRRAPSRQDAPRFGVLARSAPRRDAMFLSVFDMFKIGIGPSSSHTVGPMVAARRFILDHVEPLGGQARRLTVTLHGSLAFTGKGHGTD